MGAHLKGYAQRVAHHDVEHYLKARGRELRDRRLDLGIPTSRLAQAIGCGVAMIYHAENGRNVRAGVIAAMSIALQM